MEWWGNRPGYKPINWKPWIVHPQISMMLQLQNRPVRLRVTCLSGGVPLLWKIFPRFQDRRVKKYPSDVISKKRQIFDSKNLFMFEKY